jgi:uncharacterized protein with HEPN domain
MSKREPALLIQDMLEAIEKIERFISGFSIEGFLEDDRTIDAVVRNLEIMGEAAGRLPEPYRNSHLQIEWPKIIGLRNRIVHAYFGMDLQIIWSILQNDLHPFKEQLEKLLDR